MVTSANTVPICANLVVSVSGPGVLNSTDLRYITNHSYEKTNPRCPQISVLWHMIGTDLTN
jgi:hypothetical protein